MSLVLKRLVLCAFLFLIAVFPVQAQVDDAMKRLYQLLPRLQQPSNLKRFEAVKALLVEHDIAFEVQKIPGEDASYVKDSGGNFIVTLGEGANDLLVGAHFDAARLKDGTLSPAMVDNGASVMVLLRLATTLKKETLRHRLRILLFDQEELGLLGSKFYIESTDPHRISGVLNLDVITSGTAITLGPSTTTSKSDILRRAIRKVCSERGVPAIEFPRYPQGDDVSFEKAGIPNVSIGVIPEIEAHQLWLRLNGGDQSGLIEKFVPPTVRVIHSPDDTLEKVSPRSMTLAYEVILETVRMLDQAMPVQ